MKKIILTILVYAQFIAICFSQVQFNNFEFEQELPVMMQPSSDTLWQIGPPAKPFFNQASSFPNAIMTDSINNYPINQSASFELSINESTLFDFPYIQIDWNYKLDTEDGVDGGLIETSYDGGQTWTNVFTDPEFRPFIVGDFATDTLFNGQVGLTGVADWSWMAICWGTYFGELPILNDDIKVRFTFVSDSIDTQQEGWMLDDFQTQVQVIGSTFNQEIIPITVFPNPTTDLLFFNLEEGREETKIIEIYDNIGQLVFTKELNPFMERRPSISVKNLRLGNYNILVRSREKIFGSKFVKR